MSANGAYERDHANHLLDTVHPETIKAIAVASGCTTSAVGSAT
jgi:hypothetical protein